MAWASIIIGGATLAYGVVKDQKAKKDTKAALGQRKAYKTPEEVFEQLQATQNRAQGDTQERDFLTGQLDNSFSQQLGTAELLGADANDLSSLFNQKMQGILKIGQEFHATNMESFGKYLGALDLVAQNKAAEAGSADNLIKDQLQALSAQRAQSQQEINSGINAGISGIASYAVGNLYNQEQKGLFRDQYGSQASGARSYAKENGLNYDEYKSKANKVGSVLNNGTIIGG